MLRIKDAQTKIRGIPQQDGPHNWISGATPAPRHCVRLNTLPDGVEFPEHLRARIAFDPAKGRLSFCGFMCKSDFDRLTLLSTDLAYRCALERLFQISTEAELPQLRRFKFVLVVLVIMCLILSAVIWSLLLHDTTLHVPNDAGQFESPTSNARNAPF